MKKLLIAALMVVGMTAFAQENAASVRMTPEQRNELQLKKLTLNLELNEKQQKEMGAIIAEQSVKRQAVLAERRKNKMERIKLTPEQRAEARKKLLDEQIATKQKVKKVLTPAQFEKWEKMNEEKRQNIKDGIEKHKAKGTDTEDISK